MIDLQAALQASQGSGSTSVLREPQAPGAEKAPLRDPADELIDVITQIVEPEQWERNGGSAATIRLDRDRMLIIRAPGYIHR
jgi:hypothetical protein